MAHIKARKPCTILKHIRHDSHLAGVQILHARDGFKFLHIGKPTVGSRRAGIGERGVKDHLGHRAVGAVGFPAGSHDVRVQAVGRARSCTAQVVVVEREPLVRVCIVGISLLGISTNGAHQGYQHDNHSLKDRVGFHICKMFDSWGNP